MSRNEFKEYVIDGAFVAGFIIVMNSDDEIIDIIKDKKWIKLSEIKSIVSYYEDGCIFYLYKDQKFFTPLPCDLLRQEINRFLFKPEECSFTDNN